MDFANELSKALNKNLKNIEELTNQTAVHRKKFEFALSQIKKFTNKYNKRVKSNKKFSPEEKNAALSITYYLNELQVLMRDYLLEKWTNSTIDNSSDSVLNQLQSLFINLKEKIGIINPSYSKYIVPYSNEWNQYHILDLRAIAASFTQYLNTKKNDSTKQTQEMSEIDDKMIQRLKSIHKTITIIKGENNSPSKINESSSTEFMASRSFSPIPVNYRKWLVNIDDFEKQNIIGSGVSATVYRGIDKRTSNEVAIKEFKYEKMNGNNLQAFQREVAVLATVNHPTLLKLIGATDTPPFCIITEWMPQGSLFKSLHDFVLIDPTTKTIAAFDIARGMQYLHNHHIVHRDLKSLNVLMDNELHIRICDFAFSRHATDEQTMTSNIGTPHWMAPEILFSNQNYTAKVDVYAYGILLWELVTSQIPYNGLSTKAIMFEVRDRDIRPNLPSSDQVNPSLRDLITQCWDRNPDNRPSFDEIVRRFIENKVMIDGTDVKAFDKYIKTSSTISEIVNKKVQEVFQRAVKKKDLSLGAAVRKIKKMGGVPIELIEKLWMPEIIMPQFVRENFQTMNDESNKKQVDDEKSDDDDDDENEEKNKANDIKNNQKDSLVVTDEDASNYLLLFKKTSKIGEAARVLRSMKNGAVPHDVMCEFITEVPTGSNVVDADIVIAACKNGCADFASLYASKDSDISIALLVCARNGVDVTLMAAVTDLCVMLLASFKTSDEIESLNANNFIRSVDSSDKTVNINNNTESIDDKTVNDTNNNSENIDDKTVNINNNTENIDDKTVNNTNNNSENIDDKTVNNTNNNSENIDDITVNNYNGNTEAIDDKIISNTNSNSDDKTSNSNKNDDSSIENKNSNTTDDQIGNENNNNYETKSKNSELTSCNNNHSESSLSVPGLENQLTLNSSSNAISASSNLSSTDGYFSSSAFVSSYLDSMNESDFLSMKNASALLCLVGIGRLERITQLIQNSSTNFLLKFLKSQDKSLRNAALVASVALVKEGKFFMNIDDVEKNQNEADKIFEALLDMIENEPLAASVIVNIVGKQKYYADKLISKISQNYSDEICENVLKALISSAKIKELRDKIKSTLQNCKYKLDLKSQIEKFLSLI